MSVVRCLIDLIPNRSLFPPCQIRSHQRPLHRRSPLQRILPPLQPSPAHPLTAADYLRRSLLLPRETHNPNPLFDLTLASLLVPRKYAIRHHNPRLSPLLLLVVFRYFLCCSSFSERIEISSGLIDRVPHCRCSLAQKH